jgi:1-acyl-sn-glycerol-3-phosphate acyltransferase
MNFIVCAWIIALIPEFVMRFVVWILASTIYRITYTGRELIPSTGAALVVANHVSFIDWFIVAAACRRPVRFVMYHHFFMVPGIKILAEAAKAIPIAPAKENPELKEKSFAMISASLRDEHIVCIFPEGGITRDGKMLPFKPGVDRILQNDPVPVFMIALNGLWGSFFSRKGGRAMTSLPRPTRRQIRVEIKKFEGSLEGQPWSKALETGVGTMVET